MKSSNSMQRSKSKRIEEDIDTTLNTEAKDQSLWLVKIPHFVASEWSKLKNNDVLGSLTIKLASQSNLSNSNGKISKDSSNSKIKQLCINLNYQEIESDKLNANGRIDTKKYVNNEERNKQVERIVTYPKDFTLEEVQKSTGDAFYGFSSSDGTDSKFTIDGRVTKNLILKPAEMNTYNKLVRERSLQVKLNSRHETSIADAHDIHQASIQSQNVEFISTDRSELKRKAALDGKTANKMLKGNNSDSNESSLTTTLRSKVFEIFLIDERQTYKDILMYCKDIPNFTREDELKVILNKYTKYNRKGIYRSFYELKPEFKDYSMDVKDDSND